MKVMNFFIVTADKTWTHNYDPEMKRPSMEYHHKSSKCGVQ